ncbi:MAG: YggT family protein [Deltaproteobacteria bacterium]|nr:YggT family protein [Deltaproteobacteria bacterium]
MLHMIVTGLTYLIIADAVLSWILPPNKPPRSLTRKLTDPMYAPIRKVLSPEKMGGLDLSPMVLIFGLQMLDRMF